jgi:hypothetical protein
MENKRSLKIDILDTDDDYPDISPKSPEVELKNYENELDNLISIETNEEAKELYLHIQSLFKIINDSEKHISRLELKLKKSNEENIELRKENEMLKSSKNVYYLT